MQKDIEEFFGKSQENINIVDFVNNLNLPILDEINPSVDSIFAFMVGNKDIEGVEYVMSYDMTRRNSVTIDRNVTDILILNDTENKCQLYVKNQLIESPSRIYIPTASLVYDDVHLISTQNPLNVRCITLHPRTRNKLMFSPIVIVNDTYYCKAGHLFNYKKRETDIAVKIHHEKNI